MASEPQNKQSPSPLSAEYKKQLRSIGHALKPVVMVAGGGLSDGVLAEIDRALNDHELIKIKLSVGDRELKKKLIQQLCEQCHATLIQTIGNIVLVLRKAKKTNPQLSNLQRLKK
jgi:RNA-binding protein